MMRYSKWIACAVLACSCLVVNAFSADFVRLRVNHLNKRIQFVVDATGPFTFKQFALKNPDRLVVDANPVYLKFKPAIKQLKNTPVKAIRFAQKKSDRARLVFDLQRSEHPTVSIVKPSGQKGYRLLVSFNSSSASVGFDRGAALSSLRSSIEKKASAFIKESLPKAHIAKPTKPSQTIFSDKINRGSRRVRIVVDPGHGGKDPGATGRAGTHEKNVVLKISKDLVNYLNKQPGFSAVLTRRADYYISLRERLAIARRYKADMFIAVHADAFANRRARGASVYALSQRGATSEAARWLAEKENKSELMGGVDLADKTHLLRSVLLDLSQTATISTSLIIGKDILNAIKPIAKLHHGRVEQAAFVVLKSPDIPSLLVETGFLSNAHEERQLRTPSYQRQIAYALMKGVRQYFVARPPRGTWLYANRAKSKQYTVVRGDTLSAIAARFSVSAVNLKRFNQLRSAQLSVGQILKIPVEG